MKHFRAIGRLSAVAAAVALVATPAFAASSDPTAAAPKQERAAPKAKTSQQYCVQDDITGSRMPRKVCKTRAEWISEDGFDPLSRN